MARPAFLIVGAMKAGTTTLYRDLQQHPDLFLPAHKEPEILVREEDEAVLPAYARHFRGADAGQLCGEASTAYTKQPQHVGVADRALRSLGPGLKIIYIRRDPVARARSHYQHDRQHGLVDLPFASAVHRHKRFVDFGRYDWQIEPWIQAFGPDQVMQLELESYSAARRATVAKVLQFIGADPAKLDNVDEAAVANSAAEQKHIDNPLLRSFIYSGIYQTRLKPLMPKRLREHVRRTILPTPDGGEIDVDEATAAFIREQAALPG